MLSYVYNNINYVGAACLFVTGLYIVLTNPNLIKKIIGINVMETSVFLLFVTIGYVQSGRTPIIDLADPGPVYVNPLPSALILTGIVVAVSITVFALGLVLKIYEAYGTLELDEIQNMRSEQELG